MYDSSDFARTPSALNARLPQTLIHRDVAAQWHSSFSDERRHGVAIVDLPSITLSMTLGHLKPGHETRRHRHNYETILYVIRGRGFTLIQDERVEWTAGDAIYIPVWAWHSHHNVDSAADTEYLACENAALLQNLGELAVREEAPMA